MKVSGINIKGIDLLSGLANNSDSIVPMMAKDIISNGTIVYTYAQEGGKDDAREKFIEEYGTGAAWLLSIPVIKKIVDSTLYKKLNLNPDFDERLIVTPKDLMKPDKKSLLGVDKFCAKELQDDLLKNTNAAFKDERKVFETLNNTNDALKNIPFLKNLTNAQLYKGLFAFKFISATALSAALLIKIIQLKQKSTDKRIEKDVKKNHASSVLLNRALADNANFDAFNKIDTKKPSQIAFKGAYDVVGAVAHNPILNNFILDGFITGTRLKQGRKGEKLEIGFKELFQIAFTYLLAKPTQRALEILGENIKKPIALDPRVLFDKKINEKLPQILDEASAIKDGNIVKNIYELAKNNPQSPLVDALAKNGNLKLLQKDGITQGISYLKPVDENSVKNTIKELEKLNDALKDNVNIKSIRTYKVLAVFLNLAFGIWATGVLQPKLTILLRKTLNGGDNRNHAIVEKEKEIAKKYENI